MYANTGPIRDGIIRVGKGPYTSPKILGGDGEPKNLKKTVWRTKSLKLKKKQKNGFDGTKARKNTQKYANNAKIHAKIRKNIRKIHAI